MAEDSKVMVLTVRDEDGREHIFHMSFNEWIAIVQWHKYLESGGATRWESFEKYKETGWLDYQKRIQNTATEK